MDSTNSLFRLGDDAADKQYRAILSFDTGALPNDAVITRVTLKIRYFATVGTDPFTTHGLIYIDIATGSFSTSASLQLDDFQATASLGSAATIPNTPVNSWYARALGSSTFAYISLTSRTQFRLRFQTGDNDDLSADYLKFYSGNGAAAYRPKLIIQYYVP